MDQIKAQQLSLPCSTDTLPYPPEPTKDIENLAGAEHGVVYTRTWVVEFILDLCGYEPDENLVDMVTVEPSCGTGEFVEAMARRLSDSCRRQGGPLRDCAGSLHALELNSDAVAASRKRVRSVL